GLGRTNMILHSIDVGDAKPLKQRHWPISPAREKIMFAEVDNMLALDIIEPSNSPWSSNCVIVQKGSKFRLCLDSREVNNYTRKDAFPLPHIDGILKGFEMPVGYMSVKLSKAQRNYTITELECLAVIKGIKKFRAYIEGQDFLVVMDHAALQWLMRQKDLSGRLARWSIQLQGFDFRIEHRKGFQTVIADTLSRQNESAEEFENLGPIIDLESEHFRSLEYLDLMERIRQNQEKLPDLRLTNGYVYKRT
ncbi:hypothetical protein KR084_002822, partial [Drosophila pseudotakahashii]